MQTFGQIQQEGKVRDYWAYQCDRRPQDHGIHLQLANPQKYTMQLNKKSTKSFTESKGLLKLKLARMLSSDSKNKLKVKFKKIYSKPKRQFKVCFKRI